jgi:hypothetical protein
MEHTNFFRVEYAKQDTSVKVGKISGCQYLFSRWYIAQLIQP